MAKQGKKRTKAQFAELVAVDLQKLVRLKAADDNGWVHCVDGCGHVANWKEMQGGHYMPRRYTGTKLMEENIHPQAPQCNFLMSKGCVRTMEGYRKYMVETYGEGFIEDLIQKSRETKKWDRYELEEMRKEIREQIKQQLERVGS